MAIDFGSDVLCVNDLDPMMREVTGFGVLYQDLLHAVTTPRGRFIDAPESGVDASMQLSKASTRRDIDVFVSIVRGEVEDDDRVQDCSVSVDLTNDAIAVTIEGHIVDGRPFRFVVDDWNGVRRAIFSETFNG